MADKASANGRTAPAAKAKPAGITKIEAVRQALSKLGKKAKPIQIREFIKANLGIEMTGDHISTCKNEILRRKPGKAKPAKPVAAKPVTAPAAKFVPAAARNLLPSKPLASASAAGIGAARTSDKIQLADVLAIKDLLGRIGSGHLKALVDAFAR
jgi:hypothetical protein